MNNTAVFTAIYVNNTWRSRESRSGFGSKRQQTQVIRRYLRHLVERFKIGRILDVGCGDLNWMSLLLPDLALESYVGIDVVPHLIARHQQRWRDDPTMRFQVMDITAAVPPRADLVLMRDCLFHLSTEDAHRAIANILKSRPSWMLLSTAPATARIQNRWRAESGAEAIPIDLLDDPFRLTPVELVDEHHASGMRFMGLYEGR